MVASLGVLLGDCDKSTGIIHKFASLVTVTAKSNTETFPAPRGRAQVELSGQKT